MLKHRGRNDRRIHGTGRPGCLEGAGVVEDYILWGGGGAGRNAER